MIIRNNKAQIHMMETIAVLLIFFVLILVGIVFYANVMRGSLEIEAKEARELDAIGVAQRAINLPEIQCSKGKGIVTGDCVDVLMMDAFIGKEIVKNNQLYYHERLGFSKITIWEIYPNPNKPEWVLYNKTKEKFKEKIPTSLPVSLKYSKDDKYSFGIMQVDVYI